MKASRFVFLQRCLPQQWITYLAGRLAFCESRRFKNWAIRRFIRRYGIDVSEARKPDPNDYPHFNAFFTRSLREGARSFADDPNQIASPVDGQVVDMGLAQSGTLIQAKSHHYTVEALLGDKQWALHFDNAPYASLYLSPKDYHRVHLPTDARLIAMRHIPGKLFSVNQQTTDLIPGLYTKNTRVVTLWETVHGPMAVVFVGAMMVGSVSTPWAGLVTGSKKEPTVWYYPNTETRYVSFRQMDECGRFLFGSTVVLLMPKNAQWDNMVTEGMDIRLGNKLGYFPKPVPNQS